MEKIILAGGCFWCTEAIFQSLKGVASVIPGYSGGTIPDPSYWDVASGRSGHAECVEVTYDPNIITIQEIFDVFFRLHDPTQLNKQGADVGTQYRSAIFYLNDIQKEAALKTKKEAQKKYNNPIVTEITEYKNFYKADESHKDYYYKNKGNIYCTLVIDPKIAKLKKDFGNLTKK